MNAGGRILLTLWVGALWSVGYLAVPVLFAALDDRALAGMLAGRMFELVAWIGLTAGVLLAIGEFLRSRPALTWRFYVIIAMTAGVAVGYYGLQAMMAELKTQGLEEGSAQAAEFARLHGISSLLYLAVSLGGLALVATDGRRPRAGG